MFQVDIEQFTSLHLEWLEQNVSSANKVINFSDSDYIYEHVYGKGWQAYVTKWLFSPIRPAVWTVYFGDETHALWFKLRFE